MTAPAPARVDDGVRPAKPPFAALQAVLLTAAFGVGVPLMVALLSRGAVKPVREPPPPLDMVAVAKGHQLFASSCVACHGADAHGLPNLGKDLTAGFAKQTRDADLVAMIARGRQPGEPGHTAAVPMPPKGGHAEYTMSDIGSIVSYLRSLQDPSRVTGPEPTIEVAIAAEPTPAADPAPAAAPAPAPSGATPTATPAGGAIVAAIPFDAEAATRGRRVFMSCVACHGKTAGGQPHLGADLLHSQFVATTSDDNLAAFIRKGRLPSDPDSKLKLTMPPKGGNPAMTDAQIHDVIAYLRSLQAAANSSANAGGAR